MNGNTNGFRTPQAPSKKDQMRQITTELQNIQMATRITQMLLQKFAKDIERLDQDMNRAMSMLNNLEYRTLATVDVTGVDKEALNAKADQLKLTAYNEASDADDKEKGLIPADVVENDSYVLLTSEAPDEKGIFRSKVKVSEVGVPELEAALLGKKVGDKFPITLNGVDHVIEVLGIRKHSGLTPETLALVPPVDTAEVTSDPVTEAASV